MKQATRKVLSILLAIIMVVGMLPAAALTAEAAATKYAIFFQNNWKWTDVCLHYWGSASTADTSWPGVAMEKYGNDGTYDIYKATIPTDVTGIVISGIKDDGSGNRDQSPNIEGGYYDGICYYMLWNNGNKVGSENVDVILPTDYYLVGYINGADHGSWDDAANLGNYRFENGKLTATFTKDSYVFVKTNRDNWYMTAGWQGEDATQVILQNNKDEFKDANKLFVPAGVEANFEMRVNLSDDTITLGYTITTCSVSFNAGEGSGSMTGATVNKYAQYELPASGFTAPEGKRFKAWKVGDSEYATGEAITVTANTTVTAVWEDVPATTYTVTATASPAEGGTVTGTGEYEVGKEVTLTVTPNEGYVLDTLTVDGNDVTNEVSEGKYTFNMPANTVAVSATFKTVPVTLTLTLDRKVYSYVHPEAEMTVAFSGAPGQGKVYLYIDGQSIPFKLSYFDGTSVSAWINFSHYTLFTGNHTICADYVPNDAPQSSFRSNEVEFYFEAKNYSVTIDSSIVGGSVTADKTTAPEGAQIRLTVTPEEGFMFDSFTVTDNIKPVQFGENEYVFNMPAGDVVVTASFAAETKTHTVTFDYNDGATESIPVSVEDGQSIAKPADPTWTGHSFQGWYDENDQPYDFTTPVTGDITLTAKWDLSIHRINVGTNVEDVTAKSDPQFVDWHKAATATISLYDEHTAKYEIVSIDKVSYWIDNEEIDITDRCTIDNEKLTVSIPENIIERDTHVNVTVKVKSFGVTFDYSDGVTETKREAVAYGETVGVPADPTWIGYSFQGWYDENGQRYDFTTPVTGDITLTAKWKAEIPAADFTATGYDCGTLTNVAVGMQYSLNQGDTWVNITADTVDLMGLAPLSAYYDEESRIWVKMPGNGTTTVDSEIQKINVYRESAPSNVASSDYNMITGVTSSMEYRKVDAAKWTRVPEGAMSLSGLEAGVYEVRTAAVGKYLASDSVRVTVKDVPVYTITYETYGGTINGDYATEYTYGEGATLPTDVTRAMYSFRGWSDSDKVFNEVTEIDAEASGDKTFYAWWETATYTVTFHANNGTDEEAQVVSGIVGTYNLPGCSFTAPEGKRFAGWAASTDGEVIDYLTVDEDTDLYAIWESDTYTITFDTDGGSEIEPITQDYGTAVTAPTDPTKEGYHFVAWDQEIPETMPATDMTVKALWEEHEDEDKDGECDGCTAKTETVKINIYRNGNTEKAYKEVYLKGYFKDDLLDAAALNIADYYVGNNTGSYEFEGWYNDGGWNAYKDGNPDWTLGEVTINGWTNINCMVTDYETVVVKAVVDGDKDNAETLTTTTALHGSLLADTLDDITVENRTGYLLDKWYNWDWFGHKVGDNATVNGWTNVYVTYTTCEHDGDVAKDNHDCDACGKKDISACFDEDDHKCDICGETVTPCFDVNPDGDHLCDVCKVELSECADNDNDHFCDDCGVRMTSCRDKAGDGDHNCDICKKGPLKACVDTEGDKDHKCDECEKVLTSCKDKAGDKDHLCDECGKGPLKACANNNPDEDHNCDECGKVVNSCRDSSEDDDHACDVCGHGPLNPCVEPDGDKNHECDICGATVTECVDKDKDHFCDECEVRLSYCADPAGDKDHKCDYCGHGAINPCADSEEEPDHYCDECGKRVSSCTDVRNDGDHKCDICGHGGLRPCADSENDGDHKCDDCGKDGMNECADSEDDKDHVCDECGVAMSLCADNDGDHKCDVCEEIISLCVDDTDDHKCDICEGVISLCVSNDDNHECDICGEVISLCADKDDHKCDICGEVISLCASEDDNHECDICGETISLCADNDNDHDCDICGEVISLCADTDGDHACDLCEEVISLCADEDDHKCDICGETISECADSEDDDDYDCDVCGKTLAVPSTPVKPAKPTWMNWLDKVINNWKDKVECPEESEPEVSEPEVEEPEKETVPATPVTPAKPNWCNIIRGCWNSVFRK